MVSRRDRKEDAEIAELDYRQHPLRPLRENIMLSIKGLAWVSRRDNEERQGAVYVFDKLACHRLRAQGISSPYPV